MQSLMPIGYSFALRRLAKIVLWLAAGMLLLAFLALWWFSFTASFRESETAGRAGIPGTYVRVGDVDMRYRQWGPDGAPPILLIHGTMAWSGTWFEIAERLAARGHRVLAPNLPPFGFSTRPADRNYSRAAQARLILGFADALRLDHVLLVGHSFGAGATVEAAFSAPARVDGLVLLDGALGLDDPSGGKSIAALFGTPLLGRSLAASTFTNPLMTAKGLRDFIADDCLVTAERVAIYQQPLSVEGTSAAVADWLSSALFGNESGSLAADPENYRRFGRPVLLIWGRDDTVTPLDQGKHIKALLPHATLEILDDVNHIPHVENPDAVASILDEFATSTRIGANPIPATLLRRTHIALR